MKNQQFIPYYKVLEFNFKKLTKKKIQKNIYMLSNFNLQTLNSYLDYFLRKKNFFARLKNGPFDQIDQEIMKINENFYFKKADIVIIAVDVYSILYNKSDNLSLLLKELLMKVKLWMKMLNKNGSSEIIFFNCPLQERNFYNLKNKNYLDDSIINNFNNNLFKLSKYFKNLHIFDLYKVSAYLGYRNLYNPKNNFISKIPYSEEGQCQIASELSRLIKSILTPNKKCLVLDLDNTLWGGILGEDGIKGIQLGNSYQGENYKRFQKYLKNLKKKGVLLAINSKNNIEDVKECFKDHPEMILKLNDFVNIKANWELKYINIKKIAKELNIGMDSIVFFDDSKFEREQMKKFCSEINTIDVPDNPHFFMQILEDSGYFDISKITKEDKNKHQRYYLLKKAKDLKSKHQNFESFLKNLSMVIEVSDINKYNFERCVQMINKTNQFNLTTKRYTSQKLKNFIDSSHQVSRVFRIEDKFGDHGITGLAMAQKKSNEIWIIDTFLLSCRILGRNLEKIMLIELLKKLKQKNASIVRGQYIKTKKNQICKNFYEKNKFIKKQKFLESDLNKYNFEIPNYFNVRHI